jgi:26S proteasome regulatory subunit N1
MTSVPKPLKFLRPHYAKLKDIYEAMADGENKVGSVEHTVLVRVFIIGQNDLGK